MGKNPDKEDQTAKSSRKSQASRLCKLSVLKVDTTTGSSLLAQLVV
jgi:hypothetical protein